MSNRLPGRQARRGSAYFSLCYIKYSLKPKTALFIPRWVRRAAYMQVAQIVQRCPVLFAHSARKIRIVQPLVSRGFRHILQYAEFLLNHLLAFPRHLPPLRQHIVLDVIALLRRHSAPGIFFREQIRPLHRSHFVPLIELLFDPTLLLGREILKRSAALQNAVALLRSQLPHLIHKWARRTDTDLLPWIHPRFRSVSAQPVVEAVGSLRARSLRRRTLFISIIYAT